MSDAPDMFCPLCQSEYRDGFTKCADCHVHLVNSRAGAMASSARLWKGERQKVLDKILAALDARGIPSYFHEIVNARPHVTVFGISLMPRKSTFEYEVWCSVPICKRRAPRSQTLSRNLTGSAIRLPQTPVIGAGNVRTK